MAISISRAEVKRKCMIPTSDTSRDSDIDALIGEMQPSVEYTISDGCLNDTGNTRLQATLKLGILEIISGECLRQMDRESGASETLSAGGITLGARRDYGASLAAQGAERLRPYLKAYAADGDAGIGSTTMGVQLCFTDESMRSW